MGARSKRSWDVRGRIKAAAAGRVMEAEESGGRAGRSGQGDGPPGIVTVASELSSSWGALARPPAWWGRSIDSWDGGRALATVTRVTRGRHFDTGPRFSQGPNVRAGAGAQNRIGCYCCAGVNGFSLVTM
jgi:hypothetical protein